ncbi:MAG TPA: phage integrase N-terminal SAM-like domain-containing protein [Pyrinomonadaceae bacterium]|nr:phage integrase N-terminal SAM-like domain-containing protein [Pyrinomonadaceae bacterium]
MRMRHYSYKTEKIYVYWMRQYFFYHKLRHPKEMGAAEVESFLTHPAGEKTFPPQRKIERLPPYFFFNQHSIKLVF